MSNADDLLATEDVTAILKMDDPRSAREWLKRARCPFIRIGKRKVVLRRDLVAVLESLRVDPRQDEAGAA
jgi:hypothetical protein